MATPYVGIYASSYPTYYTTSTTTPPARVLVPAAAHYWNSGGVERPSGGQIIREALAVLKVDAAGSSSVTVTAFNTGGGGILLLDGERSLGVLEPASQPTEYTYSGLSGGVLTCVFGAQQRSYEEGDVQGAGITRFAFPEGQGGWFIAPAQARMAVVVVGDSISNGSGSSAPQRLGWTALLRDGLARTTYVTGYGSAQGVVAGADANWPDLRRRIAASLAGAERQVIVWALGSNDAMGARGPGACTLDAYMASFRAFLDNTERDFPGVYRLVVTPVYRRGESTVDNGFGWRLPALRAAETASAGGRPRTLVLDGYALCADADISQDGAHPLDQGHAKIAAGALDGISRVLGGETTPAPSPAPVATDELLAWVPYPNSGSAVSGSVAYQAAQSNGGDQWGGGLNSAQRFTYPTGSAVVTLSAPAQQINRALGVYGGTLFGAANMQQTGDYRTIRHAWYWDGIYVRVFELGTLLYQGSLPEGPVTFAIELRASGISYLLNGSAIALSTPSSIGIPSGEFGAAAALSTPGDPSGSGSHVSGARIKVQL